MRIDAILISHCYNGITKVYYVGTELSAEDHRKLSIYKPKAPAIADPALFICKRMQSIHGADYPKRRFNTVADVYRRLLPKLIMPAFFIFGQRLLAGNLSAVL